MFMKNVPISLVLFSALSVLIQCQDTSVEYWLTDIQSNIWLTRLNDLALRPDSLPVQDGDIVVDSDRKFQQMDGFGASLTDASTWLLKYKLSESKRSQVLEKLFGVTGIGISALRQPIGASDFNWEIWSLDDIPADAADDDYDLKSFAMWREDDYIRPMLDLALGVSKGRAKLFATPWSPPAWMKTNRNLVGANSRLRPECYSVLAEYIIKYLKFYASKNNPIYGITVQNEPMNGPWSYPGMLMSADEQIDFIARYLGPRMRSENVATKIIAFDHNYDAVGLEYAYKVLGSDNARSYVAGTSFHTYAAPNHASLTDLHNAYPDKDLWILESGSGTWIGDNVAMFQDQMMHLIRSPRNYAKGVIFWNVALDQNSAPKLAGVGDTNRGLLTIRSDTMDSVTYETNYFSLGHTSKFVDPGAHRIESNNAGNVENVAYLNPDKTIVVVLSNRAGSSSQIKVRWNRFSFSIEMPGNSAVTVKWKID